MLLAPKKLKMIAVYAGHKPSIRFQLSIYLLVIAPRVLGRAIFMKISTMGLRWRAIRLLS